VFFVYFVGVSFVYSLCKGCAPMRFLYNIHITYQKIFSRKVHDWEVDVVTAFFQKLQSISIQRGSQDKLWWIPSKKGTFKVKDFFRALSRVEGRDFPWKSVWRTKSPPRAAFFVWSAALRKFSL
jgi:hypothetical protein